MAATRLGLGIAAASGRAAYEPIVSIWDLVIVGGGPVGLVTALAARRLGLSALVLEQAHGLPQKACGEGLMPGAVSALEQLGVSLSGAREFRGVRFLDGHTVASASFLERPGRALSRGLLMQRLSERASELDVPVRRGQTVRHFRYQDGVVQVDANASPGSNVSYQARLLVAADGLRSPIRRKLGYELPPRRMPRFGVRCHFRVAPWSDWVEVHWHEQAEAYVTPLASDLVGVAVLSHGRALAPERWAALFPALAERLAGAVACERARGAGPFEQRVRGVLAPGVALVGDAAGYLDALTGEGLAIGFACAQALVERVAAGKLERYPADHRRLTATYYRMTGLLLALAGRPGLRRWAIRYLSRHPQSFSALLSRSVRASRGVPAPAGDPWAPGAANLTLARGRPRLHERA